MEKRLSVGQNALYNSVGSVIYLLCQWLITVLVVKLSSYENAGNLALAMSVSNVLYTLAAFGIRDFQVSDYRDKYSVSTYLFTRGITCVGSLVVCGLMLAFSPGYTPYQAGCILLYAVFRAVEAFVDVLQGIQQKSERMDLCFRSFLLRGIGILGVFCLVLSWTESLLLAIAGMALFSLGVMAALDITSCRGLTGPGERLSGKCAAGLLKECMPLMLNSLLTAAIVSIPRTVLEAIEGEYVMGIYASIATPAVIVQSAAVWLYTPAITTFTRHYNEKDKKHFFSLYRRIWLIIGVLVILVLPTAKLLGPWGLRLLFNEEIVRYSHLLVPVLITTILIACSYFLRALLTIARKLTVCAVANAGAALLVALLSVPFVRQWGMEGVNYVIYLAMGLNVAVMFLFLTVTLHRHFKS